MSPYLALHILYSKLVAVITIYHSLNIHSKMSYEKICGKIFYLHFIILTNHQNHNGYTNEHKLKMIKTQIHVLLSLML